MVKVDGTQAKDIALYFLDLTTDRYTPAIVRKTIMQAKQLLEAGYTKDEICEVVDYLLTIKNIDMYSLGYVSSAINNTLKEINTQKDIEKHRELIEKNKASFEKEDYEEVDIDDKSQERNRTKLSGFGNESREREESYFDMLKE